MAFKMNKPIIKGTKKHSALLATAKASGTVDPTLGTAASMYGQSMNPDVIDYSIKQTKIEWDKKKDKKKVVEEEEQQEEEILEEEEIKEDDIDYDALFAPEEDDPDLTSVERKKETAKRDKDVAIEKLELQRLKQLSVDKLSDKPIEVKEREGSVADWDEAKFDKEGKLISGEGVKVQRVAGVSAQNLRTSYSKEELNRLIFSEKHGRVVLPEEIGKKPGVVVESKKLDKKLTKATTKSQKKKVVDKKTDKSTSKSTNKTDSDKKRQDFIYKLKGPAGQKKMRDAGYKPPKKNKNT